MPVIWPQTQTLETLRVAQHFAPLCGQRGELRGALALPRHTHLHNLLGFLPGGSTAEGRQA